MRTITCQEEPSSATVSLVEFEHRAGAHGRHDGALVALFDERYHRPRAPMEARHSGGRSVRPGRAAQPRAPARDLERLTRRAENLRGVPDRLERRPLQGDRDGWTVGGTVRWPCRSTLISHVLASPLGCV
jgi:hypothetical protein